MVKPGEEKILNRPTFLHKGIFVNSGTRVVVMEIDSEGVIVQFLDKEGISHILKGVREEELI